LHFSRSFSFFLVLFAFFSFFSLVGGLFQATEGRVLRLAMVQLVLVQLE
jgi:hypothetical protein